MSATRPALRLIPERCDRCGRCVGRCKPHAITLGPGYIYIDSERCDGCLVCADVCDRCAIVRRERGEQPAPAARPKAGTARVSGGSRAKALIDSGVWTSVDALVALLALLGCLLLVNVSLNTEVVRLMPQSGKVLARVAGLALTYVAVFFVLLGLAHRHAVSFTTAFRLRPVVRSARSAAITTLLVIGLLLGTRIVSTGYALVTEALSWQPPVNWSTDLRDVFGPDLAGFALTVALAVLVGPFVEELVFRGVVQTALGKGWGSTGAVVISAALFATYHFSFWMLFPIFVLGLALGWLAERSQGLWPPITLHVLYNGVAVAAAFWVVSH